MMHQALSCYYYSIEETHMSSDDDYWKRREEVRRQDAFYDAIRDRDHDRATREAANPEAYVHYSEHRDAPHDSTTPLDNSSNTNLLECLAEQQKNLIELIKSSQLPFQERLSLLQTVHAIQLSSPDASERIEEMHKYIEGYI